MSIRSFLKIGPRDHPIHGDFRMPGDKSISHRVLILSSLAAGDSRIEGLLESRDTRATLGCLRCLGVEITGQGGNYVVHGVGLRGLSEPVDVLDAMNSGTTARLMLGVLAGQPFFSVVTGDKSLRERPMARVVDPLKSMGATVMGRCGGEKLPLAISGREGLEPIEYSLAVASAQVKSAILMAGLYSKDKVAVREPMRTRDHTERVLAARGVRVERGGGEIRLYPGELAPMDVEIPGDFSSAAFLITAALLLPGSSIKISRVGLNPTRTAFLDMVGEMGGKVSMGRLWEEGGEPVGDLGIEYSPHLTGITVRPSQIPIVIDEIPLLALLGVFANGETRVVGAGELRVKESDRIAVTVSQLAAMGAEIEELPDGFVVRGTGALRGGMVESFCDHRMAMMLAIAGLVSREGVVLEGAEAVDVSFPGFFEMLGIGREA